MNQIQGEIIQALRDSDKALDRNELLDLVASAEDAQQISRAVHALKKEGLIVVDGSRPSAKSGGGILSLFRAAEPPSTSYAEALVGAGSTVMTVQEVLAENSPPEPAELPPPIRMPNLSPSRIEHEQDRIIATILAPREIIEDAALESKRLRALASIQKNPEVSAWLYELSQKIDPSHEMWGMDKDE